MRRFFRRRRPHDAELEAELRFHLEQATADKMKGGLNAEEARRAAALEFGGPQQTKESVRDVYRMAVWDAALRHVRGALRLMRRAPGFSLAVILTLGLGIGANSVVFSAMDAVLLKPLPFPQADELVLVSQVDKASGAKTTVAPQRLEDWNGRNQTFQALSGWYVADVSELSGQLPEKLTEALVAPRFLQVWGVAPVLGRTFSREEEQFGGPTVVLISSHLWQRRFSRQPDVLGRRLRLDGGSYTIIGVLPDDFAFPVRGTDVWVVSAPDAPYAQARDSTWFTVVGRLRPGVLLPQALADLRRSQSQLGQIFPKTDAGLDVDVAALKNTTVGNATRSLWILFGAVTVLLLIACTNIAALYLARVTGRARELSVRLSLGGSRGSLVAQLMTECLVLSVVGAAVALCIAAIGMGAIRRFAGSIPRADEIRLDWHMVLYSLACALLATLLCTLVPALWGTRQNIAAVLAGGSRTEVSGRSSWPSILVGVQVALAVTLLVGAGLLLKSMREIARVEPGFSPDGVLVLRVSGNWGETVDRPKLSARIFRTLEALRSVPGVISAASAASVPGVPADMRTEIVVDGRRSPERRVFADNRFVSTDYFQTLRIPVLAGAECLDGAVVNRRFADLYLPGASALGHRVQFTGDSYTGPAALIRAIVPDTREQGLNRDAAPTVYWCNPAANPTPYLLVRTAGVPLSLGPAIRESMRKLEPTRSVFGIAALRQLMTDNFAAERLRTTVLSAFALTAVSLVCVGLYGTMSYLVETQRREIGLCLALGGQRSWVASRFLRQGFAVCFFGSLIGLVAATGMTRLLQSMLFRVSTLDPATFAEAMAFILTVGALASLLPCLRASRVDPMVVLRED